MCNNNICYNEEVVKDKSAGFRASLCCSVKIAVPAEEVVEDAQR